MRKILASATGALGTVFACKAATYKIQNRKYEAVKARTDNQPEYKWDFNWDFRHPQPDWTDEMKEKYKVKKTRYIYMIRHGQYQDAEKDADRHLTEKGREQARLCGQYLKSRGIKPTQFVHSSMTRATETANLINEALQVECKVESSDLIREGCPAVPEPPLARYPPHPWTEFKEAPAIEAGFRKFVRRAKPTSEEDEIAVVVCHANVIRYFMCRGLQLPPTAWLHMTLHHASVSSLHCRPSGTVGTRGLGEAGFLPKDLQTVSNIPMQKPAESMASK